MSDESDRKYVIFLDSLGPDDIEQMQWTRENLSWGKMNAWPVYVTPTVLGSIYTGENPGTHGLPAASRYDTQPRGRPAAPTIPEIAAAGDEYETVVQMGLPFIVPPDVDAQGDYYHHSGAMGQASTFPPEVGNQIAVVQPPGDLDKPDENFDLAFDARVDFTHEAFGRMRNFSLEADADVVFFGYRQLDAYTHYRRTEDYRDLLLEEIDRQIQYTANLGDVFIFGDHGSMEMDEVFRINHWLMDQGYLDAEIDHEWREKAFEYGVFEQDDSVPGEMMNEDSPGVTIDEETSVAIGADPFSGGVTLLDGADEALVESLIEDLEALDPIAEVFVPAHDGWSGDLLEECPDLYAVRRPGVFISGNFAPEMGGPELTRDGVHHQWGGFGSTAGLDATSTDPEGLFTEITEGFLGIDPDVDVDAGLDSGTLDDDGVREHLEDLGYI